MTGTLADVYDPLLVLFGRSPFVVDVEGIGDAVFVVDREFVLRGLNDTACELYGFSREQAIGASLVGLLHADDVERTLDYYRAVFAGERPAPVDATRRRPDGSTFWVSLSALALRDDSGHIVGALCFARDIGAHVEARAAAERQLERLDIAAQAALAGSWEVDLRTGLLTGSKEYHRIHLRDPDSGAMPLTEALDYVDDQARHGLRQFVASGEEEFAFVYVLRRDPANIRIIEASCRKVPGDEPGHPGHVVGISRDITEKRALQARHDESVARFRSIFYNSLTPSCVVDAGVNLLLANHAFCEFFGYGEDELGGLSLDMVVPADSVTTDEAREALTRGLKDADASVHSEPRRFRRKDGAEMWVTTTISVLSAPHVEEGTQGEFLVQFADVTEERAHKEYLRHLAEHDPLTGLFNRRAFLERLTQHLSFNELTQRAPKGAVMILDLDRFKAHNDTYGHASGDSVLIAAADELTRSLRSTDVVARLGGDEFVVLLPDLSGPEALEVAHSLVEHIRRVVSGLPVPSGVTATIGVAGMEDRPDLETVMKRADDVLYDAKREGKDRAALWVPGTPSL